MLFASTLIGGLLFHLLHWPGGNVLLVLAVVCLMATVVLSVRARQRGFKPWVALFLIILVANILSIEVPYLINVIGLLSIVFAAYQWYSSRR